jgi:hypothetical protein
MDDRDFLVKELEYRRKKLWDIFSWVNTVLALKPTSAPMTPSPPGRYSPPSAQTVR